MVEIVGNIKNYDWGKLGLESEVAKLGVLNSLDDFNPNSNTPYSELWMGDHPSGQSKLKSTGEDLGSFLTKNRLDLIGGLDKLPYLFKVLSIRKALSIQVHPNKEEAEKLYSKRPDIYKDPNHKPELAIALTPFLALCGFRPNEEIENFAKVFSPISELLGNEVVENLRNGSTGLKDAYVKLMTSSDTDIQKCIEAIAQKYTVELEHNGLLNIFNKLMEDFPNDVGILSLFFFNLIHLSPGEAIYLPANEPHAYLDGDCIECMACSDNVIRAGLTPKYKDVETLLRMLNYKGELPENKLFEPIKKDECLKLFIPNIKDFAVGQIHIKSEKLCYKMENNNYGSIILVLKGKRKLKTEKYGHLDLKRGSIVFIPGDAGNFIEFTVHENETTDEDFISYIAMCNYF